MASVSTYLNFKRNTEEAFNYYRKVFGTDFVGQVMRFGDMPPSPGQPPLPDEDTKLIMHMTLPILGGHLIMGTDAPESMGFNLNQGNNVYINLEPDTRGETDRLFNALADGGKVEMALAEQFWGDYYGSLKTGSGCSGCSTAAARPDRPGSWSTTQNRTVPDRVPNVVRHFSRHSLVHCRPSQGRRKALPSD